MTGGDEGVDEEVELPDQESHREPTDDPGERLEVQDAVDRPRPGVGEYQPIEDVWPPLGGRQTDRAAPVLRDQRHVFQPEGVDETRDHFCVLLGEVAVSRFCLRESEPRVVHCDATEVVSQRGDDVTPEERPGRVAMQEKQCRPGTLVDVVHGVPVDLDEAALERKQVVIDPGGPRASAGFGHDAS